MVCITLSLLPFLYDLIFDLILTLSHCGTFLDTYEEGVKELTAEDIQCDRLPRVLYVEPASKATTKVYDITVDRGISWVVALKRMKEGSGASPRNGFYRCVYHGTAF